MNPIRTLSRRVFLPILASSMLLGSGIAWGQEADDLNRREERRVMKASEFSREELSSEYRRMARQKRHQEMEFAKELLSSGRMTGETKAEMMLRLADLYFEEGRDLYLTEMEAYEKQFDACFNDPKCSTETMQPDNTNSHRWQSKSIKLYRQILRNYATFQRADEATFYLASALQETGERKEGIQEFTRLARIYPDSEYVPDAYVQIGEYYFDNNNAYKALLAYQKAAAYRNSPKYAFAMYKLGWCYYNVGEYGKGIDTMKAVVAYSMSSNDGTQKRNSLQLEEEALADLSARHELPGEPGERRIVHREVHSEGGLFHLDPAQALPVLGIGEGLVRGAVEREVVVLAAHMHRPAVADGGPLPADVPAEELAEQRGGGVGIGDGDVHVFQSGGHLGLLAA